jgi:FAD binding domain
VRTSHIAFAHDALESLGSDWSRIAGARPGGFPAKVYLPETTADVVAAVREAALLGQRLTIRAQGHSSNDLVTSDRGALLWTERLDGIGPLDEEAMTVTVQAGAKLGRVDAALAEAGCGLPVMPDHPDLSAGGYASVGGLSPASHRHGLFVDTIAALEYVDWTGRLIRCSRERDPLAMRRVLTGAGRHGVIATLTCDVERIDKTRTLLRNDRGTYRDFAGFARACTEFAADPGDALYSRAVWLDTGKLRIGQLSAYRVAGATRLGRARNDVAYGLLHRLGRSYGGRSPRTAAAMKAVGSLFGMVRTPRYATVANVEAFTDKVIDHTVGDPARTLVAVAPVATLEALFHGIDDACVELREREGCFTFVSMHAKAIRSPYLGGGDPDARFGEIMLVLGLDRERMHDGLLAGLVARVDALCLEHGAVRLLHTSTGYDPRVDPNTPHALAAEAQEICRIRRPARPSVPLT